MLNELSNNDALQNSKRLGRGIGSGKGKTCGRGHKGQKSRSGVAVKGKGFEGGQMPLFRRLPKRGFNNIFKEAVQVVNLSDIQKAIDSGKLQNDITKATLAEAGLIRKADEKTKLLGTGEIKSSINITLDTVSKSALDKVEKSGGKVVAG